MRQLYFILLALSLSVPSFSQSFTNDDTRDELFLYQVKGVDEFIDRFNDDRQSYIRKVYQKEKKPYHFTRLQLLVSLFNRDYVSSNADTVKTFIRQMIDARRPQYLFFSDSSWYAEATGLFTYNGKTVEIPVMMHIRTVPGKGGKWMISGIGNGSFLQGLAPLTVKIPEQHTGPSKFIATTSFATNFVELNRAFSDKTDMPDFFEPEVLATEQGRYFIQALMTEKLKFLFVKQTRFHFCQLDNWVFVVEEFNRKSKNSGWLISNLKMVTSDEKEMYRRKLLYKS